MCTQRRIANRPDCFISTKTSRPVTVTFKACRLTLVVLALQAPVFAQEPELDLEVLRAAVESNVTSISSIYATYTLTFIPNELAASELGWSLDPSGPRRYEWEEECERKKSIKAAISCKRAVSTCQFLHKGG